MGELTVAEYVFKTDPNVSFAVATSIGFAWALRNLLLLSTCRNGECPEQFIWLYIYFAAAFVVLIMTLVPEIKIKSDNKD